MYCIVLNCIEYFRLRQNNYYVRSFSISFSNNDFAFSYIHVTVCLYIYYQLWYPIHCNSRIIQFTFQTNLSHMSKTWNGFKCFSYMSCMGITPAAFHLEQCLNVCMCRLIWWCSLGPSAPRRCEISEVRWQMVEQCEDCRGSHHAPCVFRLKQWCSNDTFDRTSCLAKWP